MADSGLTLRLHVLEPDAESGEHLELSHGTAYLPGPRTLASTKRFMDDIAAHVVVELRALREGQMLDVRLMRGSVEVSRAAVTRLVAGFLTVIPGREPLMEIVDEVPGVESRVGSCVASAGLEALSFQGLGHGG